MGAVVIMPSFDSQANKDCNMWYKEPASSDADKRQKSSSSSLLYESTCCTANTEFWNAEN